MLSHHLTRSLTFASCASFHNNHYHITTHRPCHHIPGGKASTKTIRTTDDNHPRIEAAFQKYFHRADYPDDAEDGDGHRHEVEIIVCHANVIRYFLCRG